MENQPELEDGEIESDVEDIGQTRPVKKLKKNCRDAFIIAEKAAGSWRNLSEYSPNDSPINRMDSIIDGPDESFDVLLTQYYKLRGELNQLKDEEEELMTDRTTSKSQQWAVEKKIASHKAKLTKGKEDEDLDEIQLRLLALESTLSHTKDPIVTPRENNPRPKTAGKPVFGCGRDVDMRFENLNNYQDVDMRSSWTRNFRPPSRNGKSRRGRPPLLETPTKKKRIDSIRKNHSSSSKESSRTNSTATPNSLAEIGPSDRLAEILRIKNSILTNEDPDAQYWEFLKMVNRPSMSGEISLDKRDDLDPINMEVVSEAEDSAFPTTSHQSFGHSQGEFYSSTNQLRQFSAVPVTKFNQPDSFKSSYQSGWTAPMVHSLMPNTFFMQNYQTFPPLPPPIRSTPPPPPPVAQWTQVSPEKVPIKNTTQTSGKLEADKEVADVIKKIFECSQLSEDEATVPPIMQLKSAQSTGSSKLSEKFDEAVEVEEKTIESESDNDEEVEALRALVIGTMCKKKKQTSSKEKRRKSASKRDSTPIEVEMGQMHKGGTAEQRSPSSDRSVTLLEETYANSNSPKTRLSYMGMMEMDSSDQQAEEQEEFNTRQVELTCEDEEIILSSPDSMDRRNVETAELKTPAALSPSWYHMDRTVLVNQKKFKPTTPLTVVAGPSGTRVIDRRKPKMPAPVQYFKAPPQHKPLIIPVSDESDEEEISNLNSTVHSHASAIVTAYLQEARISVEIKEKQEAERKLTDVSQLEERLLSCEKDLNSHRSNVQEDRKRLQSLASVKATRKDDLKSAENTVKLLREQLRKAEINCDARRQSLASVTEEILVVQTRLGEKSRLLDLLEAQWKEMQMVFVRHKTHGREDSMKPSKSEQTKVLSDQLEQRRKQLQRLEQECLRKMKQITPSKIVSPIKAVSSRVVEKRSTQPAVNLPHKWTRASTTILGSKLANNSSFRLKKGGNMDRVAQIKQRLKVNQLKSPKGVSKICPAKHEKLRFTNTHPMACLRSFRLSGHFKRITGASPLSLTYSNKLDPNKSLCPFDLTGECKDESCCWQHRREYMPTMEDSLRTLLAYQPSIYVRNGLRRLIRSAKKSSALAKDQIVVEYLDKLAQKNGKYDVFDSSIAHTSANNGSDISDSLVAEIKMVEHVEEEKPKSLRYYQLPLEIMKEPESSEFWLTKAEEELSKNSRNEEEKVDGAISYLCKGLELHRDSEDLWLKYFELLERKSTPTDTLMKLLEQAVGRHVSASVALNWKLASLESNASRKVQIVLDFLGDEAVETQPVSTKLSSEIVQFGLWGVVVTEAYNIPLKMSEIFQLNRLHLQFAWLCKIYFFLQNRLPKGLDILSIDRNGPLAFITWDPMELSMDWEDVKSDLWQDGNFCRELENLINAAMECVSEPSAVLQECFAQFTVLKQKILVRMLVRQVLWKSPVSLMVSQLRFVRNKKPVGTEVIKFPKQRYVEPPTVHLGNLNPLQKCADAEPISGVKNPYEKEKRRCLLCRYDIKLDYKNPRLLSQFVSAFTGRFYEKHITGLCEHQQKKLYETIKKSRMAGYMPVMTKDPRFLKDPRLFDPMNPQRPNPY